MIGVDIRPQPHYPFGFYQAAAGEAVMSGPWIGNECEEWQAFYCGYSVTPDVPRCDRDAKWHGVRLKADGSTIGLPSCDEHKPVVDELCDYVHPHVHPCGMPDAMFREPENECYIEWDDRPKFARAVTVMAGSA